MAIANYTAYTTTDWRGQLQINERKTRLVIALFLLTYALIGFLVDIFLLKSLYPAAPLEQCFFALIYLRVVPIATIILLCFAVVALLIVYTLYDRIMLLGTESREILPATAHTLQEKQLYNVVEEMQVAAGLRYMPKVYLIDANYMNAFASGYSEKSAMVAITRGLLEKLDRAELQAVMSHELSHIRHHDIKLTLMVAVLSNIMLIVVDLLFYSAIFNGNNNSGKREDNRLTIIIVLLRYLLPIITIFLALFLNRTREYMADAGAVELMRNNEPMARALIKISEDHEQHVAQYVKEYGSTPHEQLRQSAYLFDPSDIDPVKSFFNAFSTHPTLIQRLAALGFKLR